MLQQYFPIAQSIATLFSPFVEVVIHNLKTDRIEALFHQFSNRQIGDPSNLKQSKLLEEQLQTPYKKMNVDGRELKSISTLLRDEKNQPIGLMCINMDVSGLKGIQQTLEIFLSQQLEKAPAALFENDWPEKIHYFVQEYCQTKQVVFQALTKFDKKKIIQSLHMHGAFEAKDSAAIVGQVLKISRATVYKYLKEVIEHEFIS